MRFYDDLLVTSVQLYGVNCREDEGPEQEFDLASCTFTDVDRTTTVSPLLEELLVGEAEEPTGGVKGMAREAWLLVRDGPPQPP